MCEYPKLSEYLKKHNIPLTDFEAKSLSEFEDAWEKAILDRIKAGKEESNIKGFVKSKTGVYYQGKKVRSRQVLKHRESEGAIHMIGMNTLEWFVTPAQLREVADYLEEEWKKPSANVPGWIFRRKRIELHVHYDQYGEEGFIEKLKEAIGLDERETSIEGIRQ